MNDINDIDDIDDIGRRAGAAAKRRAQRSIEVRHGLDELRSASRARTQMYRVEPDDARRMTPRAWVRFGSAIAVAAAVLVVFVLVTIRDPERRVLPATVPTEVESTDAPATSTIATSAIETTVPASLPNSTVPATVPPVASGLTVSYLDPPPRFQPDVFAVVPVPGLAVDAEPAIAVGESGVAVLRPDGTGVTLISPDALSREVDFAASVVVSEIALGPSDVLYGLTFRDPLPGEAVPEAAIVAIALSGPDEGSIVAEAPLPAVLYVELSGGVFGHGQRGIVDRVRFGGQLIEYVDTDGKPLTWTGDAPAEFAHLGNDDTIVQSTAGTSWPLVIERDPQHSSSFAGDPPPAAAPDGRGVYATSIGASIGPDQDYSPSKLPVVATLNPDGSAEWALLPEGWRLGASDVWGTVLAHVGQDSTVELAWLIEPNSKTSLPGDVGYRTEPINIESSCSGDFDCTRLAVQDDGVIVTFEPGTAMLTVHDTPVRSFVVDIDPSGGGYLVKATDAGVAYVLASDPAAIDPVGTLYAVSTAASNVGSVVASVSGMSMSGDSELVADELGLVLVGCCGFDQRRPPIDEPVVMRWVDSSGAPTTLGSPVMHIEFRSDGSADIVRNSPNDDVRRWTVPDVAVMRGMPPLVPLANGGAAAFLSDSFDPTSASRLVVLHPDGTLTEHSIGPYYPVAIEPAGTLIVSNSLGGFSRLTLR